MEGQFTSQCKEPTPLKSDLLAPLRISLKLNCTLKEKKQIIWGFLN